MSKTKKLNLKSYNLLIFSCILWGFSPIFYRHSLAFVGIFLFLFFRYLFGAIFIVILDRKNFIKVSTSLVISIALLALVDNILANTFYSIALQKTSVLHASIIALSVPFFVYFFASVLLHEKVHRMVVIGGVISASGLLITMIPSFISTSSGGNFVGDLAMLMQAICCAFGIVIARKLLHKNKVPSGQFSFLEYLAASIGLFFLVLFTGGLNQMPAISLNSWVWIIATSIVVGGLPIRMYFKAAKKLPAERLADGSFVIPLVVATVGVIYYKEAFTLYTLAGLVLVVAGLLVGHNKIHPVLAAHRHNLSNIQLQKIYRVPKKAYEYITINSRL